MTKMHCLIVFFLDSIQKRTYREYINTPSASKLGTYVYKVCKP
jgi:hypothetical protein